MPPLEEKKVRRDVQAALAKLEVLDCATFALVEGSADKLREWLHSADIGLPRDGLDKIQAAKVVAAWETAVDRNKAQRQVENEQHTAGLPAAIPGSMFVTIKKAWEAEAGTLLKPSEDFLGMEERPGR